MTCKHADIYIEDGNEQKKTLEDVWDHLDILVHDMACSPRYHIIALVLYAVAAPFTAVV